MKTFLYFFLIFYISATAQERIPVDGHVSSAGESLENVNIQNISSMQFSVSTKAGNFRIFLAAGDTLILSHVGMIDYIKIMDQSEMNSGRLSIVMTENDTELKEVIIQSNQGIDVVSLGIISERREKLSLNERRLETAGDFKWYHLFGLLGGSLQLDPILNAVNGRTKELKKNIRTEQNLEKIILLEGRYMDYMKESFAAPENEIQQFLDYLVEQQDLEGVLYSRNEDQVKFYLTDRWFIFKKNK